MAKKSDKKKSPSKSSSTKKKMTAKEREELLIENFVGLQHAMTNLSIRFENLSEHISKLLNVFEEAAKNFASGGKPDNEDLLKKVDNLIDQNKTIAKGLVMVEDKLRGKQALPPHPTSRGPEKQKSQFHPKPLPRT